jgi:hypothetical protein
MPASSDQKGGAMYFAHPAEPYAKRRCIEDNASDVALMLDVDDVDPADVSEDRVRQMVEALNLYFYPAD